jgi:anionic cell wall polymer biosynthesis LytR-Cps2A-Psr (LCP) family protein
LTLEDFLGIKIDYTVKVSFDTVVGVVDELGGIEINSDTELRLNSWSKEHPGKYCYFYVGAQWVDGDCALRFARERKSYYTGDRHRGENQQEVLTGIVNKLTSSRDYILRLPAILEIVGDSFITSFSREAITDFISFQLNEQVNWQIERANLDGEGALLETYTYVDDNLRWVMIPDEESLKNVKDKINEFLMVEDEA